MKAIVSVCNAKSLSEEGVRTATQQAIEDCEFRLPRKLSTVMLKVNLRYYWDSSTGETTDPRIASAIVDYVADNAPKDVDIVIAEADASAMRTRHAFRMLGYGKIAAEKNVRLLNLCECDKTKMAMQVRGKKFLLPVAKPVLDSDLLINVPKLRTHRLTKVSVGLKNMFGAIARARKITYHPHLNEVIVAANKLMKPHLTVVDGITALGKRPLKLGLVMASKDQLAIDCVAARLMGYNPRRVAHLVLAEKHGIGCSEGIKIAGEIGSNSEAAQFLRENYTFFNFMWRAKLILLKLYLNVTGDTRPPVLDEN